MPTDGGAPSRRSDAQRNRARILEVAATELTRSPDAPLSAIAKKAGVGQATFYRNFPTRQDLVFAIYRDDTEQLAARARELATTAAPETALREWLQRLAQYAMAKVGLAPAIREVISAPLGPNNPAYLSLTTAIECLLDATKASGVTRQDLTADDVLLAIAGLLQLDPHSDWQPRAQRLIEIVLLGLRRTSTS